MRSIRQVLLLASRNAEPYPWLCALDRGDRIVAHLQPDLFPQEPVALLDLFWGPLLLFVKNIHLDLARLEDSRQAKVESSSGILSMHLI